MQKLCLSEKTLKDKNKDKSENSETSKLERYTIFHALFETLKDKDNKQKKR